MDDTAPEEGQHGEQQQGQGQQQGEQAPQEQQYKEFVAAAPAVLEEGAGMDAPVGEEGLEEFDDVGEDLGAAEGGDVDMFL